MAPRGTRIEQRDCPVLEPGLYGSWIVEVSSPHAILLVHRFRSKCRPVAQVLGPGLCMRMTIHQSLRRVPSLDLPHCQTPWTSPIVSSMIDMGVEVEAAR